ncbi:YodL domain-containing protein [Intestinimonas butyriciproducens]
MSFYKLTSGILIPAFGYDGKLQGMQIMLDVPLKNKDDPPEKEGAKYIWFSSSSKKDGSGSGSPVHLIGDPHARVVYVIEGLLKADISHCLTGRTFAAIAGANNTEPLDSLFGLLAQGGTEEIVETHDMDKYSNQMTMNGALKIYQMARSRGMNCRRLTWNPNYKGFDDWQLSLRRESRRKKEIDKFTFKEKYLCGLCEMAHIEDCTEQWHRMDDNGVSLTGYLGLTKEEYAVFLRGGRDALCALLEPQRRKQRFTLYQLELDEQKAIPFAFKGISALKKSGCEQPPAAMYRLMWSSGFYCPAEQDDDAFLRRLFADCMERLPAGARGRPMAPSDVVELERDGRRTYYYVSDKGEMVQVKFSPLLAKKAAQDGGSLS